MEYDKVMDIIFGNKNGFQSFTMKTAVNKFSK